MIAVVTLALVGTIRIDTDRVGRTLMLILVSRRTFVYIVIAHVNVCQDLPPSVTHAFVAFVVC